MTAVTTTARTAAGSGSPVPPATRRMPQRLSDHLRDHLRDPLHRDGYALIAGSAITSALGMVFWLLAARRFDPADLGVATALISVMGFLATVATLGLRNGLIRFLPVTRDRGRLIRRAYAWCGLTAAAGAAVFLIGQPAWAGELGLVRSSPGAAAVFVAATVVWMMFVLQDAVLTGLRRARWVPIENAAYAVAKLLLLLVLAAGAARSAEGILIAWVLPAAVLLVPVTVAVRRVVRSTGDAATAEHSLSRLVRFAAADHASTMLWLGTTELVPLLVLAVAGPGTSAIYYLAFTVAYTLYLVTSNVSSALVVEAALHPERTGELTRRAALQAARLVVPAAALGCALAPALMGLLGRHYDQGTDLLRLLLLSALPQIVVGTALGAARARQRLRLVVAVQAVLAAAVVLGALVGVPRFGLDALGWTWLGAQTALALVLGPPLLRRGHGREAGVGPGRGVGRGVPARALAAGFRLRTTPRAWRRARAAAGLVPRVLEAANLPAATSIRVLRSDNDVLVALVVRSDNASEDASGEADLVVKVAMTPGADDGLSRHAAALARIGADPRCRTWREYLPRLIASVQVDGRRAVVESRLPGRSAATLRSGRRAQVLAAVAARLSRLHQATAYRTTVGESWLRRTVDEPLDRVAAAVGEEHAAAVAALRHELRSSLTGRRLVLGTVHGDAWAGNVIVDVGPSDGATHAMDSLDAISAMDATDAMDARDPMDVRIAIADWEDSRPDGLLEVDLDHLRLTAEPGELGAVVTRTLREVEGSASPGSEAEDALPRRVVVLLAWLGHVAAGLGRTTEVPPSRWWLRRNVVDVLDVLAALDPSASCDVPVEDAGPPAPAGWRRHRGTLARTGMLAVAVAAWVADLHGQDPRSMTASGLVSLFGPGTVAALALITLGFLDALRRNVSGGILAAHLVVFVGLVHGTPAVFYETLRYSWAWKHVGVVDFIQRTGTVDPDTLSPAQIYHSWPGFFAGAGLLTELVGLPDVVGPATWAPVVFQLANLLALRYLARAMTDDRRRVWLALWLFAISNWIGQDYFSPQAMAFVLHLMLLGVVLRAFRRGGPAILADRVPSAVAVPVFVALATVVASSHQITPVMTVLTLAGLVVVRSVRLWTAIGVAGLVAGWGATVGRRVVEGELSSILDEAFRPVANAEETFAKTSSALPEQVLVSWAGRGVVVLVGLLAVVGTVRLWRQHRLDRTVLVLAAAPAAVPLVTSFGGEVIFRVYLFSLPALCLLATAALPVARPAPRPGAGRRPIRRSVSLLVPVLVPALVPVLVSALLLTGFTLAYYGKDQQYAFTRQEVAAAGWVADRGRPTTLLVVGSRNYPGRWRNDESFLTVAIDREPADGLASILADPATRLADWAADDRYTRSFVLLTRSQQIDVETNGTMPAGSIERIERALRSSPAFRVAYENPDAVVFEPNPPAEGRAE